MLSKLFTYFIENAHKLFEQTLEHIALTFISLFIATAIGVPAGLWITRNKKAANGVLGFAGILQTIPSIALLGFMIPLMGIGMKPAIVALFLYALLPIVRNTFTGISEVDQNVKEAARGMGMTDWQLLFKIELPLALPVIFAGIRTATVINVGVATLAAYIAAGGLGEFIFGGIAMNNSTMILAGALPAALLALTFDFLLSRLQNLRIKKLRKITFLLLVLFPLLSGFYWIKSTKSTKLKAAFTPEFMGRNDGYPGLKKSYGLKMNTLVIAPGLMYKAIHEEVSDVISGYSTDGRIKAYELRVLEDDKNAFPPYHASAVIRKGLINKHPELKKALELISGRLSDSTMTQLNYQVDFLKEDVKSVAREFLEKQNLLKGESTKKNGKTITIGSKVFTEQYILAEMYRLLITHYTGFAAEAKTGLGGTKICFDALTEGEIDLYPEYTGTGLQVILDPTPEKVRELISDEKEVFNYVDRKFNEQYKLDWLQPLGFNNSYALMMREEHAEKLGISNISRLKRYLSR